MFSFGQNKSVSARPNWAEVSLSALQHNFRVVQQHVGLGTTICAVVKCDAYGHGVVECSRALEAAGATWFGVTSTEEGMKLRLAGIPGRVLVMTGFWRGEEEEVIRNGLTATVWTLEHIRTLKAEAHKLRRRRVPVHLKVDTGMGRLGCGMEELESICEALVQAGALDAGGELFVEGIFSHLASAEDLDAIDAKQQSENFECAIATLERHGIKPQYVHMANSAAVIARPDTWKNIVRPGLLLYGYQQDFVSANGAPPTPKLPLIPVLSWKVRIIGLRDFEVGKALGYSGAYVTKRASKIAVLPVGYGDGLTRQLSSRGEVIVRGEYAPIVGNVAMDLTLVDVTDIRGVELGDDVILIGEAGDKRVTALEQARWSQTIPYEVLCGLSPRVPRIYVE